MIKDKIRTIPNWPKQGIMFRDITTLLKDKEGFKETIDILAKRYENKNITYIAGIESRGFIIGSALAYKLNIGFIPIRKKGKLPAETIQEEYELEYGTDIIEIHKDSIKENDSILIVDDLIATGGTALAAIKLIQKAKGKIEECCFVIDLPELKGSQKIKEKGINTFSILEFQGE